MMRVLLLRHVTVDSAGGVKKTDFNQATTEPLWGQFDMTVDQRGAGQNDQYLVFFNVPTNTWQLKTIPNSNFSLMQTQTIPLTPTNADYEIKMELGVDPLNSTQKMPIILALYTDLQNVDHVDIAYRRNGQWIIRNIASGNRLLSNNNDPGLVLTSLNGTTTAKANVIVETLNNGLSQLEEFEIDLVANSVTPLGVVPVAPAMVNLMEYHFSAMGLIVSAQDAARINFDTYCAVKVSSTQWGSFNVCTPRSTSITGTVDETPGAILLAISQTRMGPIAAANLHFLVNPFSPVGLIYLDTTSAFFGKLVVQKSPLIRTAQELIVNSFAQMISSTGSYEMNLYTTKIRAGLINSTRKTNVERSFYVIEAKVISLK
jgi:hypothetical protein